jgi:tetratricopeptide (TPR) repeat protein
MAYSVETRASSPLNDLRDALSQAERVIVQPTAGTIEAILLLLDRIEQMFGVLQQEAVDLRAEEGRWDDLCRRLQAKPNALVRAAAAAGGMAALRAKHPSASGFWWALDRAYARRQQRAIMRFIVTLAVVIGAVGGGLWLFQRLFPPDPTAILVFDTGRQLETLAAEKKWPDALTVVERSLQQAPDEPELLVWQMVLAERNGDADLAGQKLAQIQARFADRLPELWNLVASHRMTVGDLDGTEAAAQAALKVSPQDAQAYLWLASVAEQRGETGQAIELLETTATYAEKNNPQLYVTARMRLGQLLQQGGNPFATAPATTETPASSSP